MNLTKITAAVATAGILIAGGVAAGHYFPATVATTPASIAAANPPAPARQVTLPDFASLVRQYGAAVVNISVTGTRKTGFPGTPGNDDSSNDPFFQFFRGLPFQFQMPREVPIRGEGSGFIVSPDGVILTNAHVVRDATEVTVKLTDRRELRAKVLGLDPATDIAVLRVDAKDLPTVRLGDPATVNVGDWVVAIGSPFGFENSVTAGIVSAKGRSLPGDSYVPFIQTDVAVNPGNSGGPLFNMAGEVIGVNSQIYSRSGGYQGVSFAIPADVALRVRDQIIATGHARHARLGVTIQEVNQALADSFGLKQAAGALVSSVQPGSAAARAGLQVGDVVVQYNDQPIVASGDLPALVAKASPGDKARLQILRKGDKRDVTVTLASAQDKDTRPASAHDSTQKGQLGLAVRPLTPEERSTADVPGGLLVERVSGAAERAGVRPGDIILSANSAPMKSASQLRELATHAPKSIALLVQRGDARVFVPIRTG
jgi:serine protease Do